MKIELLKEIFGGKPLTLDELQAALGERNVHLEDVSEGEYIPKEEMEEKVILLQQEYSQKLEEIKLENALDEQIRAAGGRNTKAIKALIDRSALRFGKDGSLEGLDLEALKASDGYLFENTNKKYEGTGFAKGTVLSPAQEAARQFEKAVMRR